MIVSMLWRQGESCALAVIAGRKRRVARDDPADLIGELSVAIDDDAKAAIPDQLRGVFGSKPL